MKAIVMRNINDEFKAHYVPRLDKHTIFFLKFFLIFFNHLENVETSRHLVTLTVFKKN